MIDNFNKYNANLILEKSSLNDLNLHQSIIKNIHKAQDPDNRGWQNERNPSLSHETKVELIKTKKDLKAYIKDYKKIVIVIHKNKGLQGYIYHTAKSPHTVNYDPYQLVFREQKKLVNGLPLGNPTNWSNSGAITTIMKKIPAGSLFYKVEAVEGENKFGTHKERNRNLVKDINFMEYFEKNVGKIVKNRWKKDYKNAVSKIKRKISKINMEDFEKAGYYSSRKKTDTLQSIESDIESLKDLKVDDNKFHNERGKWLTYIANMDHEEKYDTERVPSGNWRHDWAAKLDQVIDKNGLDNAAHMFAEFIITSQIQRLKIYNNLKNPDNEDRDDEDF